MYMLIYTGFQMWAVPEVWVIGLGGVNLEPGSFLLQGQFQEWQKHVVGKDPSNRMRSQLLKRGSIGLKEGQKNSKGWN